MTKRKKIQLLQDENTKLKSDYELLEKREKYYFLEYMKSKDQVKNAASIIASAGEANRGATDTINKLRGEIELLNKKLAKQTRIARVEVNNGCDNCETIKQAKIDVLKELKKRSHYVLVDDIEELIKEIENADKD